MIQNGQLDPEHHHLLTSAQVAFPSLTWEPLLDPGRAMTLREVGADLAGPDRLWVIRWPDGKLTLALGDSPHDTGPHPRQRPLDRSRRWCRCRTTRGSARCASLEPHALREAALLLAQVVQNNFDRRTREGCYSRDSACFERSSRWGREAPPRELIDGLIEELTALAHPNPEHSP